MINYFNEITKLLQSQNCQLPDKPLNIIFLIKDLCTKDTVITDEMSKKFNLPTGTAISAGTAPRLTYARSEIYWLKISLPFLLNNLRFMNINPQIRILLSSPESVITRDNHAYLENPLYVIPHQDMAKSLDFIYDFAQNGEAPDRINDFLFQAKNFFHTQSFDGYLPLNERCLIFTVSTPSDHHAKMNMALCLQTAHNNRATVIEKPCYWIPDYIFKTFGYGDAKSMAQSLLPEHYPPSCEGRVVFEAVEFFKRHEHIVMKPSNGANGIGVKYFDMRGLDTAHRFIKTKEFEKYYNKVLANTSPNVRMIIQPYLSGLHDYGEVRVFIYGGKIMPVGIRLYPAKENVLAKIFHNAKLELFLLTPEYLDVAIKFVNRSSHLDLYYFGLDLIKSKGADGLDKIYMTEANFMVSGFFDRIAHKMDTCPQEINDHIANLSLIHI